MVTPPHVTATGFLKTTCREGDGFSKLIQANDMPTGGPKGATFVLKKGHWLSF